MDEALLEFYDAYDEDRRLERGRNRLEFVRVQEIVRRFLPDPPAAVIDIGGATGVHAEWLAADGYIVHLVDLVPAHIEAARARAASFTATVGDARSLVEAPDSFDAALLSGPLYHLLERADRVKAWSEAARVVRPGGVVLGTTISRWAVDLDLALRPGAEPAPGFVDVTHFHAPDEAVEEAAEAGLTVTAVIGVEGPGWLVPGFDERWDDPAERATILELARATEQADDVMGLHAHLLTVAIA